MGLSGRVKVFPVGRQVYVPFWEDGKWSPISGVVENVVRGQIHVKLSFGLMSYSPVDRTVSLTEAECNEICNLLNSNQQS